MISVSDLTAESLGVVMTTEWDAYTLHQDADAKDHVPATDGKSRSLAEQEYGSHYTVAKHGGSRRAIVAWSEGKPVAVLWYTVQDNALSSNGGWRETRVDVDFPWLLDTDESIAALKKLVVHIPPGATVIVKIRRAWRAAPGLVGKARAVFMETGRFEDFGRVLLDQLPPPRDYVPRPHRSASESPGLWAEICSFWPF